MKFMVMVLVFVSAYLIGAYVTFIHMKESQNAEILQENAGYLVRQGAYGYDEKSSRWHRIRVDKNGRAICSIGDK